MTRTKLFSLAESLGGVESLVCHPATMTHASIPVEVRASARRGRRAGAAERRHRGRGRPAGGPAAGAGLTAGSPGSVPPGIIPACTSGSPMCPRTTGPRTWPPAPSPAVSTRSAATSSGRPPAAGAEDTHQLRVWARRADAALRLYADLLPPKRLRWFRKWLERSRGAAGRVRDSDVFARQLSQSGRRRPARLKAVRRRGQKGSRRWPPGSRRPPAPAAGTANCLACVGDETRRATERFADRARATLRPLAAAFFAAPPGDAADDADLHRFRIRGKELRYAGWNCSPGHSRRRSGTSFTPLSPPSRRNWARSTTWRPPSAARGVADRDRRPGGRQPPAPPPGRCRGGTGPGPRRIPPVVDAGVDGAADAVRGTAQGPLAS